MDTFDNEPDEPEYNYENDKYKYDEEDEKIQTGVKQWDQQYDESAINTKNFGLMDVQDPNNIYAMKKMRMIEGEEKFYLRQLIYAYNFLIYKEKLPLKEHDFNKLWKALQSVSFYTKKSPLGVLLAYYIYDPATYVNTKRFNSIMGEGVITANKLVPIDYMYKVSASDLVRYTKMYKGVF